MDKPSAAQSSKPDSEEKRQRNPHSADDPKGDGTQLAKVARVDALPPGAPTAPEAPVPPTRRDPTEPSEDPFPVDPPHATENAVEATAGDDAAPAQREPMADTSVLVDPEDKGPEVPRRHKNVGDSHADALSGPQQAVPEAKQKLTAAEQELSEAKQKLTAAEQKLIAAEQELSEAEQKLSEAEQELSEAKQELSEAEQELSEAEQKRYDLDSKRQQLKEGTRERDKADDEWRLAHEEVRSLRNDVQTLNNYVAAAMQYAAVVMSRVSQLEKLQAERPDLESAPYSTAGVQAVRLPQTHPDRLSAASSEAGAEGVRRACNTMSQKHNDKKSVVFHHDKHSDGKRVGRVDFDCAVIEHCDKLLAQTSLGSQDTLALAVAGASGTGKTYSILSFIKKANSAKHTTAKFMLAYIGFNIDWQLTDEERILLLQAKHFLQGVTGMPNGDEGEIKVFNVVLGRLVAVLHQLVVHHAELMEAAADEAFDASPLVKYDPVLGHATLDLKGVACEKALELGAKYRDGERLVVVVNLDEAQMLDELAGPWGARLGLRVLRQVQQLVYNASKGKCLLLPVATGINPNFSVMQKTEGANEPITTALLTLDDFTTLTQETHSTHEKQLTRLFAAAHYPRVREMRAGLTVEKIVVKDLDLTVAGELLHHAMSKTEMPRARIPLNVHARGDDEDAVPLLDLAVWPSIVVKLKDVGFLPFHVPMALPPMIELQNCFQFEERAFQVIGFVRELLCSSAVELQGFKDTFRARNPCFVKAWGGSQEFGCKRVTLQEPKLHFHPFERRTSHADAATGPLSPSFLAEVRQLVEKATTIRSMMVWTGCGDAPFDFVCVQVIDLASRTLKIALGDAKHRTDGSLSPAELDKVATDLAAKSVFWFAGIREKLSNDGFNVDPTCAVSLLTNAPLGKGIDSIPITDGDGQVNTIHVLSPSNFCFPPWTDLLFRCPKRNDH